MSSLQSHLNMYSASSKTMMGYSHVLRTCWNSTSTVLEHQRKMARWNDVVGILDETQTNSMSQGYICLELSLHATITLFLHPL